MLSLSLTGPCLVCFIWHRALTHSRKHKTHLHQQPRPLTMRSIGLTHCSLEPAVGAEHITARRDLCTGQVVM